MALDDFLPGSDATGNALLRFSAEVDKMTKIERHTMLVDGSRRENDAEHSWHIALMAMLFREYAPGGTDVGKAVRMCLVHDLVEIYAGDTFAYDKSANDGKEEREKAAADKLFSQLPGNLGKELRGLWEEFDEMKTPEARYAASMDRLQPFLHNTLTGGATWREGHPTEADIKKRMQVVLDTMPALQDWYDRNIARAKENKWIE